jgi:hypothetical protein
MTSEAWREFNEVENVTVVATYEEASHPVYVRVIDNVVGEFKRSDEPSNYYSTNGGGCVIQGETFNFRLSFDGNLGNVQIRWEHWADVGGYMDVIADGTGTEIERPMTVLGWNHIRFYPEDTPVNGNCFPAVFFKVETLIVHNLTISAHHILNFTNTDADGKLAAATNLLRKRDRLDDRRVGVKLQRQGNVTTFGQPDPIHDPTAYIYNESQLNNVFAVPGHIKIVGEIQDKGPPPPTTWGVTVLGSWNMIIRADANPAIWAHEFGHAQGLDDNNEAQHRIMSDQALGDSVNIFERQKYK